MPVHFLLSFSICDSVVVEATTFPLSEEAWIKVSLPSVSIEGDAQVGDVQSGRVGGDGDDVPVLYPRKAVVGHFVFGQVVDGLPGERLLDALHGGHILRRVGQLLVVLRMRAHIVQVELLRVLAFLGSDVFQETVA